MPKMTFATASAGCQNRPASLNGWMMAAVIGVSVVQGQTALTLIPSLSWRVLRVERRIPWMACFEVWYKYRPRAVTEGVDAGQQGQRFVGILLPRVSQEDSRNACEVKSANKVDVQDLSMSRILFDAVNSVVWIKPVAMLEDARTRNGVVDAANLIKCFHE